MLWREIPGSRYARPEMTLVKVSAVIACDKREAFAQGSEATKQSIFVLVELWIASLRSQ